MNRTRTVLATTFALLLAASTASAATITFTFFTSTPGSGYADPDLPNNVGGQDGAGDLCGGGNLDICASMLQFAKGGVTLQVTASRPGFPGSTQPMYVNEDLSPVWGGLGVDGGTTDNTGNDNNGVGEMLSLSFSQPVKLLSFVAFRDHKNFFEATPNFPTTITAASDAAPSRLFQVPVGTNPPGGTVPDLPELGSALFTFSPTFVGSMFDFSIDAETFYISMLTVEVPEQVPEPATLLLLGVALLGGAGAYRRRATKA